MEAAATRATLSGTLCSSCGSRDGADGDGALVEFGAIGFSCVLVGPHPETAGPAGRIDGKTGEGFVVVDVGCAFHAQGRGGDEESTIGSVVFVGKL